MSAQSRTRLGDVLVASGAISSAQLSVVLQERDGKTVIERLTSAGIITEAEIASALAEQLHIPLMNLSQVVADPELLELVPMSVAERYELMPVRRTKDGIGVVMADPTDIVALDDVRMITGISRVARAVAPLSEIREARGRVYEVDAVAAQLLDRLGVAGQIEVVPETDESDDHGDPLDEKRTAPVIGLVNAILADAVRARATDVHIEPTPQQVDVRYRVDGLLREVMTLPKHLQALIVSRLKVISGMDIADRRRPQDGRTRIVVDSAKVDLRISTIPTMPGEKVVARLLYKDAVAHELPTLGLTETEERQLTAALARPQGLIVFTGPTGSGKTSTMYGSLRQLHSPQKNVITLEDPIEYELSGMSQMQIDEKSGITFARGLRSVLRQDPDVIMVGEIRDQETASIVMQAAMTGHLVLSSLHTNDAASAITRLVDLGVEPFLVSSGLTLVVAQRLVRLVCEHCKTEEEDVPEIVKSSLGLNDEQVVALRPMRGKGCEACTYTGYRGRTGIYEILPVTREIREQIDAQISETAIVRTARAGGVQSLRQSGFEKIAAGLTTLDEVLRVTHSDTTESERCPGCRQEVDPSFVICPYCQYRLAARSCPSCERPVQQDWQVCPYCESALTAQVSAPVSTNLPRVLVVDDDPVQLSMMERGLRGDYESITASTGHDALREANLRKPDLILLDLNLPDMRGVEVTKLLRESAATSLIPVIMLTGSNDQADEIASLRAGVDDFITKPFEFPRLQARIEKALLRRRPEMSSSEGDLGSAGAGPRPPVRAHNAPSPEGS